jgi:hypothetical protein
LETWVRTHPPTPALLLPRAEVLAFAGRHEEALQEMAAAEAANAGSAVERASLRQYVEWLETGSLDLTGLSAAVAPLPAGSDERRMGEASVALAASRDRFMAGDPEWFAPLESARSSLGSAPTAVILRDTWLPVAAAYLLIALAISLVISLSRLVV